MAENVQQGAPKKRKSWMIWAIVAVMTVVLAGGGSFLYFRLFRGNRTVQASAPTKTVVKSTLGLEPFLVNLADKGEVRFVKASFRIGLAGEKEADELGKDPVFTAAVRDAIISLLTAKTSDQILTPEGKEALRREILTRVNMLMPSGKAHEVYIVDFMVQL